MLLGYIKGFHEFMNSFLRPSLICCGGDGGGDGGDGGGDGGDGGA